MFGRRDSFGANLKRIQLNIIYILVRGNNLIHPAPGAYNIPSIFDKKRKSNASFSNSPRNLSNNSSFCGKPDAVKFPGPGAYFNI